MVLAYAFVQVGQCFMSVGPAGMRFFPMSTSDARLFGSSMTTPTLRGRSGALSCRSSMLEQVRERKMKEVEELKANMPEDAAKILEKGATNKNRYLKAVKKPKGTISVVPQIKTKAPTLGSFASLPAVDVLSAHCYEAGAAAIAVCTDKEFYGTDWESLKKAAGQQARYKGKFPGPLPVMAYDFFIDEAQLALAASYGCDAVCLNAALLGTSTKDMVASADRMGMDALVEVHNKAELDIAIEAGAKMVGISNRDMDTFQLKHPVDYQLRTWSVPVEETVFGLVKEVPEGVHVTAMGGCNETLVAWTLRDEGYSSIMVGEAIIRGSEMRMASSAYSAAYNEAKGLIMAFKAKGSKKYGPSATGSFFGKGEGAKESLGMMSI
ncbi:hypothetical protein GUITHDRAFT_138558 [Guillardia theta CCMP2712]|uniref:indole-3-glycerol-phosphate synthase n=2 Tax=Guillardia theta TaxID=55529 RepID=L1JC08_GUITC|nr:hypothetical protein GUITHDRAFT_138558 [Guillardia theta CCMP2712]EKX46083.1 hypothetical protein GUITHDRAFT_138558 [Guillardia theta CCMP2712]|eukprot:XP_005833063.1 hypothetical protein GUITHDRAFT_138558 [Guillardia theta CCMP2712]